MTNNLLSFDPPAQTVTMSSYQMAELTKTRHDSVKRTIETLAARGVVTSPQSVEKPTDGRPRVEYLVTERDSYVVVAQLTPEFTAALVDYWQATKKLTPVALPDFNNPAVAARAWAEQYELAADRQAQLEQQQPYVEHSQALLASDEVIDMRTMAQKLTQAGFNIGRTNLFTRLIEDGILLKDKTPYRTYADWFHVEAHPYTDADGKVHASHTVLVTAKGEAALLRKYKQPKRAVSRAVIDAPKGLGGFTRALNKAA